MKNMDRDDIMKVASFAENGFSDEDRDKIRKRLLQNRGPSTQTSASPNSWINWGQGRDFLGQPFDVTKIPLSKLEQMRRDPMLAFGLTFAKIPLIRAPWYIKSSDPQRAAFIDGALRRIYGRFILAFCNCFDYGYSPIVKRFEYVDEVDWSYIDPATGDEKAAWPYKGIKPLVWKPFVALNPRHAEAHWNSKGEFSGIDYAPQGNTGFFGYRGGAAFPWETKNGRAADIPLDWALWATNEKDSVHGNIYGYPRLGYAYRFWWSYWFKFNLSDRAFERWADPPVIVRHPTADSFDEDGNAVHYGDEALALAEKLRSGANASIPSDPALGLDDRALNMRQWEIEQFESKVEFEAFNQTFEYLDIQKLRSVMVPEQSLVEGKGGSSSRNVAEIYGDLFQESQAVVMEEIDDHINRYMIPQLLEANFGTDGPECTKVTTGFDPQDIETMRAVIGAIANRENDEMPIDIRETLKRLGIPLLSQQEHERVLKEKADRAKEMLPPQVKPTSQNGERTAGVTKTGLYYIDDATNLNEEETGKLRNFLLKLIGRGNTEEE